MPDNHTRRLGLVRDAFILGLISIALQVVLARLAVSFAGGNEIYLTIFFLMWLLFTGSGAVFIKSINSAALFILLGMLSLILPALFFVAPHLFGILPGQLIPPATFISTLAIILTPICLINGALFSSIAANIKDRAKSSRTYWGEAFGALVGGAITTIFYIFGGRDYALILFAAVMCLVPVFSSKSAYQAIAFLAAVGILISGAGSLIENTLLQYRYLPFEYIGSVSGRMVRYDAVGADDIVSLYAGGVKVADFPDAITGQEIFYWPYLIKPDMKNIVLIGAETHMVGQFIPDLISYSFLYPETGWQELIDRKYSPSGEGSVRADPVSYFKQNKIQYDAIIINSSEMLSLYDKRLETGYFLELCGKSLRPDGAIFIRLPSYEGLWPDYLIIRLNNVYHSLKSLFGNVMVIPGECIYFAAGPSITANRDYLMANMGNLHIESSYFTPALINLRLNEFKLTEVTGQLQESTGQIADLEIGPGLNYFFARFGEGIDFKKYLNPIAIAIFFIIIVASGVTIGKFKRQPAIAFINIVFLGLVSFLAELLVMYSIQLVGGYLYIALGILIGLFMFGMASGSFLGTYIIINRGILPNTIRNGSILALIMMAVAVAIITLTSYNIIVLLVGLSLAGFAGGFGYTLNAAHFDSRPGLPYGFDLAGALIGTGIGAAILLGTMSSGMIFIVVFVTGVILVATNRTLC